MSFWDFIVLWLIIGFLTIVFLSIIDYKKYGMFSTLSDIIWYAFLFCGGPIYCIVQIIKRLLKKKYTFDYNWKNIRTYKRIKK